MKRKQNGEIGVAVLEFALIAILLFLLILGSVEFGILMFNQQVVTNAAREGARLGVVLRPLDYKVQSSDIIAAATQYAQKNIISFGDKNFSVPQPIFRHPDNSVSTLPYCEQYDMLTVTVSYDYSFLYLPFAKKTITSKAVMACE